MRRALALALLAVVVAGCGGSDPAATTAATTATTAPERRLSTEPVLLDVSSLLGTRLAGEPRCRFALGFVPERADDGSYAGSLALGVRCRGGADGAGFGQLISRPNGINPRRLDCGTQPNGSLCLIAPSSSLALLFTGRSTAIARRRVRRLAAAVMRLPEGLTPESKALRPS